MEEDDAPNAGIHAVVGGQQQLAVEAPVLLRVLGTNGLQSLGNAPWRKASHGDYGGQSAPQPHPWTLLPLCPARTGGLICSQDALARSHNPVSDVTELLLLLRSECWVLVGHGACQFLGGEDTWGRAS